jgi:hypothetical protein
MRIAFVNIAGMLERQRATVYVRGTDLGVESAVARTLAEALGQRAQVRIGHPEEEATAGILVTTDSAASPPLVSRMTGQGMPVVVLAAFPTAASEAVYRRAGATAYLPMVVAPGPLIGIVIELVSAFTTTG